MTAHRIWISSGQQLEDEIWADSQRCQDAIAELLQPGSPDTVVSYGAVPGGTETSADTWCGACGGFMWHGADCECADKAADRDPLEKPPYSGPSGPGALGSPRPGTPPVVPRRPVGPMPGHQARRRVPARPAPPGRTPA